MQLKFLSLGLLIAAVASVTADTVKVSDTDVKLHNTASGILNGAKVHDVAEDLRVNVASKRSLVSRRKVADAIRRRSFARRSENEADEEEVDENENEADEEEADENENEPDEEEADENENEPDEEEADENENEPDEEEADENENEPDEEEADENEVDESSFSSSVRR